MSNSEHISITKYLPHIFSAIIALFISVHVLVTLEAVSHIGRPSSTISIGYLLVIPTALIYGVIALIIGIVIRTVLTKKGIEAIVAKSSFLITSVIGCLLLITATGFVAYNSVVEHEQLNQPQVLLSTPYIQKQSTTLQSSNTVKSILVAESPFNSISPIRWDQGVTQITFDESGAIEFTLDGTTKRSVDVSQYSYVTQVESVSLNQHLAVLIKLRATSNRSMLVVFDNEFNVVHQELLLRCHNNAEFSGGYTSNGEFINLNLCEPVSWVLK